MTQPWKNHRIFIVDDSEKSLKDLNTIYHKIGFEVVGKSTNGVKALEQIESVKPDAVSLDIIMPEMDGIECYRNLKKLQPDLMVFFVSALAGEPRIVECYAEEIDASLFVPKPTNLPEMEARLMRIYLGEKAGNPFAAAIPASVSSPSS
jgi:CheY-like chemotaxis protein